MQIQKKSTWIIIGLLIIGFVVYYMSVFFTNYSSQLRNVQKNFWNVETEMNELLKEFSEGNYSLDSLLHSHLIIHIYENDSLQFWNSNNRPVATLSNTYFTVSGITKERNGWYYTKIYEHDSKTFLVSFLIKHEYAYQNVYLKNNFVFPPISTLNAQVVLDEQYGFPIYSLDQKYLFSIFIYQNQQIGHIQSLLLIGLFFVLFVTLLHVLFSFFVQRKNIYSCCFLVIILVLRLLSLEFSWFHFLERTEMFHTSLYGTSFLFPTFFDYLVNVVLLFFIARFLAIKLNNIIMFRIRNVAFIIILLGLLYIAWYGIVYLIGGIVENSNIPLQIDNLFSINIYSVLSILSIAILGWSYFILGQAVVRLFRVQSWTFLNVAICNSILGGVYIYIGNIWDIWIFFLFPYLLVTTLLVVEYHSFKQKKISISILLLALYAWICTVSLNEFNRKKERIERELYASQLITERDINTEIAYIKLEKKISQDQFLQRIISSKTKIPLSDFEEIMERRHFNKFWERYECEFYIFDSDEKSLLLLPSEEKDKLFKLNDLINNHAEQSSIHSSLFFIRDYTDRYTYVIKQPIYGKDDRQVLLYIALRSKKIPEAIGFPRLLISSQTFVVDHLQDYSIARYHKNKLITTYGKFDYPTNLQEINSKKQTTSNYLNFNEFNHLIYQKTINEDVVVLSKQNQKTIDIITSFSYLFCFFAVLLLLYQFIIYVGEMRITTMLLSTKIQIVLVGVVLLVFIASIIGSVLFVIKQHHETTNDILKDKLYSIEQQLKIQFGLQTLENTDSIKKEFNSNLIQIAKNFHTDINVYDSFGYLIGTSRKKVFNSGLISEQINPIAKQYFLNKKQKIFINKESIGILNYNSAYSCFYDEQDRILGYINLQHFGQQQEVEQQIHHFLMSVINIFVLLLTFSALSAIVVSNWITTPLRMLKEQLSTIKIDNDHPIKYNKQDEIGELVDSYNKKIEELRIASQQKAQNEREDAWREVAQQIAHEIKNPLTPMKLSVQHLLRKIEKNEILSLRNVKIITQSLIEQIDSMTKIINEFASFAKMPQPKFEHVDIIMIVENIKNLFQNGYEITINIQNNKLCYVNGDKNQLTQVFNNLIKNSVQANAKQIEINISNNNNKIQIIIADNGEGIDIELQQKLFTPHFTTKNSGSGIGLSIVKQIILNHNGNINFKSKKDIGTTFFIELPQL